MGALTRTIALLPFLMSAGQSHAVDVEFGIDALPVLIDESDEIIQARQIEALRSLSDSVLVYAATVDSVISGRAATGSRVLFAVPRSLAIDLSARGDTGDILFVTGPIDTETAASLIDQPGPLFWLVGGSNGRVAFSRERVAAIHEYGTFTADARKLAWVRGQLREDDEFLQRSALIELTKQQYSDDVAKYDVLAGAALDPRTANSTKDLALELLEVSASPRALPALRDVVVSNATTDGRRAIAIQALGRIDGGDAVLRELQQNRDSAVNGPATFELQRLRGAGLPTAASVLAALDSPNVDVRARAIRDLASVRPTENTIPVVSRLIDVPATTNLGERVALIDHLTSLNNAQSAAVLARVARDRSQDQAVRNAAIIGLAQMDAAVSVGLLRELASSLEEGTLRQLAQVLVN